MAHLHLVTENGQARSIKLSEEKVVIGRHPSCQVVLADPRASRQHAELHRLKNGRWLARDLRSRNRTYLNEVPLTEDRELANGDVIRVGQTRMEFVDAGKDAAAGAGLAELMQADRRLPNPTLAQKSPRQINLSIDEIRLLCTLAGHLAAGPEEDALLEEALRQIAESLRADRGLIALRPKRSDPLVMRVGRGLPAADRIERKQRISRSIIHTALLQGQVVLYPDPAAGRDAGALVEGGIASAMCVPIQVNKQNMGVIYLDRLGEAFGFTGAELSSLMAAATQIAVLLESYHQAGEQALQRDAHTRLQVLRVLQSSTRPPSLSGLGDLKLTTVSLSGVECVGDAYDLVPIGPHRLLFALGDIGGMGVPAALMLSAMMAAIRTAIQCAGEDSVDLGAIFGQLNTQIAARGPNGNLQPSVTLLAGLIDLAQRRLHYVNAGGPMPLMLNENRQLVQLEQSQLLLGVDPAARYQQTTVKLPRRYRLLAFSDGLTQAAGAKGKSLDQRRIGELMLRNEKRPPGELADAINDELTALTKDRGPGDDVTVLVFGER